MRSRRARSARCAPRRCSPESTSTATRSPTSSTAAHPYPTDLAGPRQVRAIYSIYAMAWGTVELEPEIRDWLEGLSTVHFARAAFYIDLLAQQGPLLGEPYTRQLDGKL